MTALVLAGLAAVAVFVLVYLPVATRPAQPAGGVPGAGRSPSLQVQLERNAGSPITAAALQAADRFIPAARRSRTETLLQVSGLPFKPAEWLVLRASAAVVLLVAGVSLGSPALAVVLLVAGAVVAVGYPRLRARRRRARFAEDLPDALQLVSGSLRAGFSLPAALEAAGRHAREPMAGELTRALTLARLGSPLEDGLDDVARRMASQDFGWVALAVRIQNEVGGNLAEIIDTTVETLRDRIHLAGQVRALSAEGRLSAYILVALPFVIGGWVAWRSPEYAQLLWTTPIGFVLLGGAAVLMVVGCLWIRAVIRVEMS
jgi:tight adherence protein B